MQTESAIIKKWDVPVKVNNMVRVGEQGETIVAQTPRMRQMDDSATKINKSFFLHK